MGTCKMGTLSLWLIAVAATYSKAAIIPECCKEKSVGGVAYLLVEETDTGMYGCRSNCVFEKKDSPGSRFCFKEGDLEVVCDGDGASTQSVSLEAAVRALVGLIQQPQPPKGDPFPEIRGPSPEDRVCIVGAGPAGIHMAQSLRKRNFEDIVIFEKSDRVGGKSFDVTVNNTVNQLSTVFVLANYFESLVPLANEYGIDDLVRVPSANIFKYNSGAKPGSKQTVGQYIVDQLSSMTGLKDPLANLQKLFYDIGQYIKVHQEMFGSYKGELMLKPSTDVLYRLRGTFMDFLERENLQTLAIVFIFSQTMTGYGFLDEIGALYGVMWCDPVWLVTSSLRSVGLDEYPLSIYAYRNGFERIWETIVDVEKLKINFNSNISKITKHSNGSTIYHSAGLEESCGFLIWAAPVEEYLKTVDAINVEEVRLFKEMHSVAYSSTLVRMRSDIRNGPLTAFIESMQSKIENGVIVEVSSSGILLPNIGEPEAIEMWDENNTDMKTTTVIQLGREAVSEKALNDILINHYQQNFNATDIEVLMTLTWEYFPRWSPADLNTGRHWDVFNMQGRGRTWFAGSSVSFESVKSVLEYNSLLLKQAGM